MPKDYTEEEYNEMVKKDWEDLTEDERFYLTDGCDPHLCCPSYPNCDISSLGCTQTSGPTEFYGHKDTPDA